jgi:WD40 repeat protein
MAAIQRPGVSNMWKYSRFTNAAAGVLALQLCCYGQPAKPYRSLDEISIEAKGKWVGMVIDPNARQLYAAREGEIAIVDLEKQQVVNLITNMPELSSFALSSNGRFCCGSSRKNSGLTVMSLPKRRILGKCKSGLDPVTALFDGSGTRLCAFNAGENTATTYEADDLDLMATIRLPEKPIAATADPKDSFFCSLADRNVVLRLSLKGNNITIWPTDPGERPSSLAFDVASKRLLVGCANKLMLMMDTDSGKIVNSISVPAGTDILAVDSLHHRVFSTSGNGSVAILQIFPDRFTLEDTLTVPDGSRCFAVDPRTGRIYIGEPAGSKILVRGQ